MKLTSFLSESVYLAALATSAAVDVTEGDLAATSPTVDLGYSIYRGTRLQGGVDQYLGMRYAQAPLGDLRFRAPRQPLATMGIQDASRFGPLCVGTGQQPTATVAEDCLFVNVYKPSNARPGSKLPVWVYIQGGGYASMGNPNYNGSEIVTTSSGNVVLVNFNYRVGVLGFLASKNVRRDGDLNAGLLDQRQLLFWVQQHISQFGGDPDHVVIQGSSAGGGSVSHHLAAYGGKDPAKLFVGAVLESPFWPTLRTVAEMEFQYNRLLGLTGCRSLSCLRGLSTSALQAQSYGAGYPGAKPTDPEPNFYWLPVIDGGLVPDHLYNLFNNGHFARVPMLVGHTTNEGTWFTPNVSSPGQVSAFLRSNYPHLSDQHLQIINDIYPLMEPFPNHADYFPSAAAAYGDATFACPANTLAATVTRFVGSNKAWAYRWNVLDPGSIAAGVGVFHTAETSAVFGLSQVDWAPASYYTTNAPIVPVTMNYWISFVRSLNPNAFKMPIAPVWGAWGSGKPFQLRLQTNNTAMEHVTTSQTNKCGIWNWLSIATEI